MSAVCSFHGCSRRRWARGLCQAHYFQARRGTRLHAVSPAGSARPGIESLRVTLALPAADSRLLRELADQHGATLSDVATELVVAAIGQGVEIEL